MSTDSLELRHNARGELVCDWGIFVNSEADPHHECGIQSLTLVTPDYVKQVMAAPEITERGVHSAFERDGRTFIQLDYQGQSWTWELFSAHWWDDTDMPIMVGRWADASTSV